MCMGVLPKYMSVNHMGSWCLQKPQESIRSGQGIQTGLTLHVDAWN